MGALEPKIVVAKHMHQRNTDCLGAQARKYHTAMRKSTMANCGSDFMLTSLCSWLCESFCGNLWKAEFGSLLPQDQVQIRHRETLSNRSVLRSNLSKYKHIMMSFQEVLKTLFPLWTCHCFRICRAHREK